MSNRYLCLIFFLEILLFIQPSFHISKFEQYLEEQQRHNQKYLGSDYYVHGDIAIKQSTGEKYKIKNTFLKDALDSHGHKPINHAITVIAMIFVCMFIFQITLAVWKYKSPKTFQTFSLISLWFVPIILSIKNHYWIFILTWLIYSCISVIVIFKAISKPISYKTPRKLFKWFNLIYQITQIMSSVGFILIAMSMFSFIKFYSFGVITLFYGLYFGLLGRDFTEMCTDRIAVSLGFSTKTETTLPTKDTKNNFCSICNTALNNLETQGDIRVIKSEKIYSLNCKHIFHEFCLRGWILIGKKDCCPKCSEKVELNTIFTNIWGRYGLCWAYVLNILRYLVVWNPMILFISKVILVYMGYGSDDKLPETIPILIPIEG